MLGFLARHRGLIVGALLALLAIGFLSAGVNEQSLAGRSAGRLTAPVQGLVSSIAEGLGGVVDNYVLLVGVSEEAGRLRREVAELKRELLAAEETAVENRRLRNLLGFSESNELRLVPARVVGRSASAWFRTVVLDKGSEDGVAVDCPVLTPAGVVGRVYETTASASRVLLITDASSAIDGVVQRTRAQVLVEGRLGPTCRILYLARGEEAAAGDRIVTSGLGGVFPKGLLLGDIQQVRVSRGEVFQSAEMSPSADLSRLEEVFVGLRDGKP